MKLREEYNIFASALMHFCWNTKGAMIMAEGTNSKTTLDPTELWKQWYETSAKAWTDVVESNKELYGDPFGLYRSWSKSVSDAQDMLQGSPMGTMDITTIWQRWFEATIDIWRKAAQTASDPLGITNKWLGMMEEAQAKLQKGEVPYTEPFTFFRDWYNATNETWSKFVEEYIGSEQFMETSTPFLESYASFFKTFRRANEEFFKNLQLPTRSDIARIAELVIALEEKVDQLDDSLDELNASNAKGATQETVSGIAGQLHALEGKIDSLPATLAPAGAVEALNGRLDNVEGKLDSLPATLSQNQAVASLNERLERVESKLDVLPSAFQQQGSVDTLAQRLDAVESKLDRLLAAFENLSVQGPTLADTSSTAEIAGNSRRKGQKKTANRQSDNEVNTTVVSE
jgi:polyhydroxyalkanoic acid synthase PhaR subunit